MLTNNQKRVDRYQFKNVREIHETRHNTKWAFKSCYDSVLSIAGFLSHKAMPHELYDSVNGARCRLNHQQ